jgi:ABC-type transporter Mla subunit MlaD
MNTQVRVGIFTVLAIVGIFVTYYFITNFSLRHTGYDIGIHFHDVGGLQEGSSVMLSGVQVGEVTTVELLPDQTVEVICTINPGNAVERDSLFMVSITFTGETTLNITPPHVRIADRILPQYPLPEDEQPWGRLPPTLTDLVTAGQLQLRNLDKSLAVVNKQLPRMMEKFTAVADDSDRLINHTDLALSGLGGELNATVGLLDTTVQTSGHNLNELSGNINGLVVDNRGRLTALIDNLALTSANLNKTMAGVASIAQDPDLHESLVGTAANMEEATAKLKAIATDIESITGDPKAQSELRGAVANLSAASAKADDILGRFSSAGPATASAAGSVPGSPAPQSGGQRPGGMAARGGLFTAPLVEAQVRETWGNRGGGPDSDLNLVFLPSGGTHLAVGANDLGYHTTYNFLLLKRPSPDLEYGGGVLYSNLGLAALFRPFGGPFGVDARLYDPKHPTLDLYGNLRLAQRLQLFYGERSIWGTAAKLPSFGLQVDY